MTGLGAAPPAGGPGGGMAGAMAAMMGRSPLMGVDPPELRPVPGGGGGPDTSTDFYDRLATGDRTAEAELRKIYDDVKKQSLDGRELIERGWWKKLLYLNDRQWIYYTSRGGWQDKRLARWIPRPVTNICMSTVNTIRGMTVAVDPSARARPNGPDPINQITAEAVDTYEPLIKAEHDMTARYWEADWWAIALGSVWFHAYWDRDNPGHNEFVQALQCPVCPYQVHPLDVEEGKLTACPDCGTPATEFNGALDPATGKPLGEHEAIGKGATDVVSPLEMLIPTSCQRWYECNRLIRLRWRPKSYYEGRPYANQIRYQSTPADRSLQMFRSLATMGGQVTSGGPAGSGANLGSQNEGVIEAELWCKPNDLYPDGVWARFIGGVNGEAIIVNDPDKGIVPGPLPYRSIKNKVLWPWAYLPFIDKGGTIWARSALDSILNKQDSINRKDSMVELIMQRMSNPIWLEPKGAEVQRFTGEPGLIVRYQVVAGTQAKPERLEGGNPPQAFFQLRDQDLQDVERLAQTQDVLAGIKPGGVEAFSALNLLVERSQAGFTPYMKARGKAFRDLFEVMLELERSYGPQARTRAVQGKNNTWTYEIFKRANLDGDVTIYIEDGSDAPKTALGKRAAMQQADAMGLVNKTDPDTIYAGLTLLGVPELAPTIDKQTKAAQVAFQQYEDWIAGDRQGPNPLKVTVVQKHEIWVQQLDRWAISDRIAELMRTDPLVDSEITLCRIEHVMGALNPFGLPVPVAGPMGPAGAPGGAPGGAQPPGGVGAGRAMANSNQESGAVDTLPGAPGNNGAGAMAPPA